MLNSVKIQRRQSEIRQSLAELSNKDKPTEEELRQMDTLDLEYRSNETRYRAALVGEDEERRKAGADLETRSDKEWADLISGFEMRQVALHLDEGKAIDGKTAEIITELRSKGGYRGVPVPWMALERRAGETIASGTPNPLQTRPIIDRLFPSSVAARMGVEAIAIEAGLTEWPVVTSSVSASWATTETGNVANAAAYATTDKALAPNNTLGIQMKLTRKALKQSGAALEDAVRRDMNGAVQQALDQAVFLGSGASGQPLGIIAGAATYGITSTAVAAAATWAAFRTAVTAFLTANAAASPDAVRLLIRPEVWGKMDGTLIASTAVSEWERMLRNIPLANIAMTANALAAPTGSPIACSALLTVATDNVAPAYVGLWGAIDLIRDPYSDAQSGGLRLTALATADVTVARPVQSQVLTGVQVN